MLGGEDVKKISCSVWLCVLFVLLFLSACNSNTLEEQRLSSVAEANENCDAEINLATPEADISNIDEYANSGGFGCYFLSNNDVSYCISGYPDVLDDYHVTQIELLSKNCHIYGFTLSDSAQEAAEHLASVGFEKDEALSSSYYQTVMSKDGVIIRIGSAADVIYSLIIQLEVTNEENVNF